MEMSLDHANAAYSSRYTRFSGFRFDGQSQFVSSQALSFHRPTLFGGRMRPNFGESPSTEQVGMCSLVDYLGTY